MNNKVTTETLKEIKSSIGQLSTCNKDIFRVDDIPTENTLYTIKIYSHKIESYSYICYTVELKYLINYNEITFTKNFETKAFAEEYCNKITELYNQFDKVERKICNYIQN